MVLKILKQLIPGKTKRLLYVLSFALCQFSLAKLFLRPLLRGACQKTLLCTCTSGWCQISWHCLQDLTALFFRFFPNEELKGNIHHPAHSCACHASDKHLCPGSCNSAPVPTSSCFDTLLCQSPVDYSHTQHSKLLRPWFLRGIYVTSVCFHTECTCSVSDYLQDWAGG